MHVVGEYGDILRALGRLADAEGAGCVEISEDDHFLTVAWQNPDGSTEHRSYGESSLLKLRHNARRVRGRRAVTPATGREELFRTLGQELDDKRIRLTCVKEPRELTRGYVINALADSDSVATLWYSADELSQKSRQRRALRGSLAKAQSPRHWWQRLLRPAQPAKEL